MNRSDFERRVLDLWMTTRVPLTRANLQFHTRASRRKLDRWLDQLVADSVLDFDSDDAGEPFWTVRGAERPAEGPRTVAELHKLAELRAQAARSSTALVRAPRSAALVRPGAALTALTRSSDEKSLIASGALSFFLGPLGWLYAAPLSQAAPAIALYLIACTIVPHLLLVPLLGLLHPLSAAAGAAYAWKYNQHKQRTPL